MLCFYNTYVKFSVKVLYVSMVVAVDINESICFCDQEELDVGGIDAEDKRRLLALGDSYQLTNSADQQMEIKFYLYGPHSDLDVDDSLLDNRNQDAFRQEQKGKKFQLVEFINVKP